MFYFVLGKFIYMRYVLGNVLPMDAIVLTKVIVIESETSPSKSRVYILLAPPPGQTPHTKIPNVTLALSIGTTLAMV